MAFLTGKTREMAEQGDMPASTGRAPTLSTSVIGAGRISRLVTPRLDWSSDTDTKELAVNGSAVLYVWGEIHYSDIFGVQHLSRFCMYPEAVNGILFSFSPHGNAIDNAQAE
jgi:hypothetical protein